MAQYYVGEFPLRQLGEEKLPRQGWACFSLPGPSHSSPRLVHHSFMFWSDTSLQFLREQQDHKLRSNCCNVSVCWDQIRQKRNKGETGYVWPSITVLKNSADTATVIQLIQRQNKGGTVANAKKMFFDNDSQPSTSSNLDHEQGTLVRIVKARLYISMTLMNYMKWMWDDIYILTYIYKKHHIF